MYLKHEKYGKRYFWFQIKYKNENFVVWHVWIDVNSTLGSLRQIFPKLTWFPQWENTLEEKGKTQFFISCKSSSFTRLHLLRMRFPILLIKKYYELKILKIWCAPTMSGNFVCGVLGLSFLRFAQINAQNTDILTHKCQTAVKCFNNIVFVFVFALFDSQTFGA